MKKAIIALTMFITLAACHANYDKTTSGLVYKIFPGKGGPKLATAKFVKLNILYFMMRNGKDSIMQSTFGKFPLYSPIDTAAAHIAYSYMEIVPKCSVGDSVEFSLSIDSLRARNVNLPPTLFPKGDFIRGRMKILASYNTREDIMADVAKERSLETDRESKLVEAYLAKKGITNAQKTKNGAYVLVEQPGTGPKADSGKQALVMYKGYLMDNESLIFDTNMDTSHHHTDPIPVTIGAHGVIPGWEDCLPYFAKGGKGKMFIPAALGYGPQPSGEIPANSNLVFEVQVVDVKDAPPPSAKPAIPNLQQQLQQRKVAPPTPAKPASK